jgi:hypothetical protein
MDTNSYVQVQDSPYKSNADQSFECYRRIGILLFYLVAIAWFVMINYAAFSSWYRLDAFDKRFEVLEYLINGLHP